MALTRSAILLFLGVAATAFYADAQNVCQLSSNVTNTNYTLAVNSQNLAGGTSYTVTLSSTLNTTVAVLFQAMSNNTSIGSWSVANMSSNCTSGFGVSSYLLNNANTLTASWTSPANLTGTTVTISALVSDSVSVYQFTSNLNTVSSTSAPNVTTANTTASATTQKSGGHVNSPTSLVLALCFLVISKLLS
ncbi:uncharacterized protein [Dendropsophus ebraccatus]|uniref:uncharacterized protein n=1 Tax=Dendropsophus ebraccatus TaxID=150705 RepID=UPI003831A769